VYYTGFLSFCKAFIIFIVVKAYKNLIEFIAKSLGSAFGTLAGP